MAKGRRLTTSRSERLLGSFGYSNGQGMINDGSELLEDEVWSMTGGMVNHDDQYVDDTRSAWTSRSTSESNGSLSSYDYRHKVGGLSLAFEDSGETPSSRIVHQFRGHDGSASLPRGRQMATSAPVNVPDWSKIYRVDSVESLHGSDDCVDDDFEWVPPHEYLARAYACSRKTAENSVCEGVGRTLKGRDMSRVRDAVWNQTGFDG